MSNNSNAKSDNSNNSNITTKANNNTASASDNSTKKASSAVYISAFTIALLIIGLFAVLIFNGTGDKKNTSSNNSYAGNNNPAQNRQASPEVMATRGSYDDFITADIKAPGRDINFTMSIDDVIKYESGLEDTLSDPSTAQGTDGFKYITFQSNPEKPIAIYSIPFSAESPGLSYVFQNDAFTEVRYQFGFIDESSTNAIVAGLTADYGESTFYRSTSDSNGVVSKTWWWKSESVWLMVSQDSAGTSLFYRKL